MIGQENLLNMLHIQLSSGRFPHFIILEGPQGGGKTLIAKHIAKQLNAVYSEIETKADAVRTMREVAITTGTKILFCIRNADNMSAEAKNSILKITEECPSNAYICMTVVNIQSVLDTIRSRAQVYHMESYTPQQLFEYACSISDTLNDIEIANILCETPGEIGSLISYARDLYDYTSLVVDNIAEVSGANAFKIASKIALKTDGEGYPLKFFFKAFMAICAEDMNVRMAQGIKITSKYLQQLQNVSLSKQMLFDAWLLDIREAWME